MYSSLPLENGKRTNDKFASDYKGTDSEKLVSKDKSNCPQNCRFLVLKLWATEEKK